MSFPRKLLTAVAVIALGTAGYLFIRPAPPPASAEGAAETAPVPVRLAVAERKSLPIVLPVIGNVQPYASVAVKSRVDGQILAAGFKEGETVQKGDLLFTIDARPYEAAVRQAEANLARDNAQLDGARLDLNRYSQLAKTGYGAQQKFEEAKTAVESLEAAVKADEAALETAKLELGYTTIRAPINGRTGNVLLHAGNLVKANDTGALVVINQVRPIYVSFGVPEQYLPQIAARQAQSPLSVEVRLTDENVPPIEGVVTFVNNAVDTTTGTIQLKATFPNDDDYLVPGAFVHVRMTLKTMENVVAVPTPAIQLGQSGSYVYVVGPDDTVELRKVSGLTEVGDETAVGQGLDAGERVVTEGQLRLRPGLKVAPRPEAEDTAS
jgi:membrane fusion protein, multidrug efflux system